MKTQLRLPGVDAARMKAALEVCERIAAKDRSNLYVTSQFFEDRARYDAFIAMYAVMRLVDDFIDNVPDKALASAGARAGLQKELDRWEQRIRAAYDGHPSEDPVDLALAAAAHTFPVPLQVWLNFVDAMRFDVDHPRFRDFTEFLQYGEGATVAPTIIYVYLLAAMRDDDGVYRVHAFDFQTCGRELGLFAYLAHILRDVKQDMAVGQSGLVYLSLADMEKHGLSESTLRDILRRGEGTAAWRALVVDLCGRAHEMEARGVAMAEARYPDMARDCAFILCLIITVYSELLRRIETQPDAVLRGDPMMNNHEKALLAAAAARRTDYPLSRVMEKMGLG
ncbi:MAG: squalene/phytoene synthase family protein [Deltaproteobacteria bacterium]|nr:squalene/phytoene synthase family protein [Deltaproteobacteria bacterium]